MKAAQRQKIHRRRFSSLGGLMMNVVLPETTVQQLVLQAKYHHLSQIAMVNHMISSLHYLTVPQFNCLWSTQTQEQLTHGTVHDLYAANTLIICDVVSVQSPEITLLIVLNMDQSSLYVQHTDSDQSVETMIRFRVSGDQLVFIQDLQWQQVMTYLRYARRINRSLSQSQPQSVWQKNTHDRLLLTPYFLWLRND